ncbi:hypothetical protein GGR54DRAFT_634524 [Hypoxylon sp. NC1633]|nr:hypothetical protein GGR54DRAFT_634524 [Hypoxylon sp. NC1633]
MPNEIIPLDHSLVDVSRGNDILVLSILFSVLVTLSTVSRLAVKAVTKIKPTAADIFIVIALAFNLTANVLEVQSVRSGFGRHLQFLTQEEVLRLKQLSQYNILFANISLWAVKISICLFIWTIVQKTHRRVRWVIYTLVALTTAASTCQGILWGIQARPLRKLWMPDIPGEVQSPKMLVDSIITFTAINSVTDLFYAISPVYFFGRLQMDLGKRLIVLGLTGSGLLVFASSIVRLGFVGDFYDPDFTWALHNVYICTIIERNIAEFIADLPAVFHIARNAHRMARGLLSHGTENHHTGITTIGSSGKRFQLSSRRRGSINDTLAYDDEIPLKNVINDGSTIISQSNTSAETHAVGAREQDRV